MMDFSKIARQNIRLLKPYASARHLQSQADIYLDANENPYTPIQNTEVNRYPDPQPKKLIHRFSHLYGVRDDQLLLTRGGDEAIDILIRTFCTPGQDKILVCPPTFGMFKVAAQVNGVEVTEVPLNKKEGFTIELKKVKVAWSLVSKLIFLVSPNNPTGNLMSEEDVLALCKSVAPNALVVIDEAYLEFSSAESFTHKMAQHPNLVILKTLSKAYGLADLRIGAVIGHPDLIDILKRVISPYPLTTSIVDMACEVLDGEHLRTSLVKILSQREYLMMALADIDCVVKVWPSEANFILIEVNDSDEVMQRCAERGIAIRDQSYQHDLINHVRVTVGTEQENAALIAALKG